MNPITQQASIQAEQQEQKLLQNGSYTSVAMTALGNKLYLGDGRNVPLTEDRVLINLDGWKQAKIAGASGDIEKLNIFGEAYKELFGDYNRINKILKENPYMTANQVAISGGAGEQSVTAYEAVRRSAKLAGTLTGQEILLEDLTAVNIANKISTQDLVHEFLRKTSAVNSADKEMADDQIPSDIRAVFAVGEHELFADGTSFQTNLRDKEHKLNISAELQKEIPQMFAQSKEDKIITILNGLSLTNQGSWSAVTGNFYDIDASAEVQVIEDAIKAYGGQSVCLMNSDTWRLYENNLGSAFDGKAGNKSTVGGISGTLKGNPKVQFWINDSLTSQTYVIAKKESYLQYIQGMQISTEFKDTRTSGQTAWNYFFDFNGMFENETNAVGGGASVGA